MPRSSDARAKAITTAAQLFQEQGYHGTGLTQIIEASGTPKGSFYFHFPKGKEQLAAAAVEHGSQEVIDALAHARERADGDAAKFVRTATRYLARWLEDSDFRAGCPVTTISLETTPESEPLSVACSSAFADWQQLIEDTFIECSVSRSAAKRLATGFVAGFEGAFVIARAERNVRAFNVVRDMCVQLLDSQPQTRR